MTKKNTKSQPPRKNPNPSPVAAPSAAAWLRRHGPWLGLLVLALLAFLPALRAGFIWDDQTLTENGLVASPAGLWKIWFQPKLNPYEPHYWPLVYSSFWLEFRLWGLAPLGYHLTNILLHGLCAVLLWRVLKRLGLPGAWLAAAFFTLHPTHAESVVWVVERKDVLSGAFYLGAALAYLRFDATRRRGPYVLALLLFAAALLCKSIVVSLPVALALALWWRRGRLGWRDLAPLVPLALLATLVTLADLHQLHDPPVLDDNTVLSAAERLQLPGQALWFYLGKLAWPHPLALFYPKWAIAGAGRLLAWLPLGAAVAGLGVLWAARRRLGRGPFTAFLFFALTLGPTLGLVKFGLMELSWVANRFLYLAAIGPLALLAAALARFGRGRARLALPVALLAFWGALSWHQAALYKDLMTVTRHDLAIYPQSWFGHFLLGTALSREGQNEACAAEFAEARRLKPGGSYEISYRLARALDSLGRPREALEQFQEMVRLKPDDAPCRCDYGVYLSHQGRLAEAIEQFHEALRLRPQFSDAMANLGQALLQLDRIAEAEAQFRQALALTPDSVFLHYNLAGVLLRQNKPADAVTELREVLKLDPECEPARNLLGVVLSTPQLPGPK